MVAIYNSLMNSKIPFTPITAGEIGLYVCGMTVYDRCHLGHARVLICFDMITRYLSSRGFKVTYVRNITDIDDKIIKRAHEKNQTVDALTAHYIDLFHQDEADLGLKRPTDEPRATENMDQIIALITRLIEKEIGYVGDNGDVYFSATGKSSNPRKAWYKRIKDCFACIKMSSA